MTQELVLIGTSATKLLDGSPTGAWAEELAAPYYLFKEAGYKVTVASPDGGQIVLDDISLQESAVTPEVKKFIEDGEAQALLKNPKKVSDIDPLSIAGIFAAGGHGAAVDFPHNKVLSALVSKLYADGKVVSTVCHGAEALVGPVDPQGKPIIAGKKVTGFSTAEEEVTGRTSGLPSGVAPEAGMEKLGGIYSKAGSKWGSHVVVDTSGLAPIVTGQNPGSSADTAKAVLQVLKN